MIFLLISLLISLAQADPIALRAPQGAATMVIGVPDSSVAIWTSRRLGFSLDVHPLSAVGASVGVRSDLFRRPSGFGLAWSLAGGPVVPVFDPGLGVSLSPALALGWADSKVDATIGVSVPAEFRLVPGADLRLPLLGEIWLGGRVGPVRIGGTLAAGQMWLLSAPSELAFHLGGYLSVLPRLRRPAPPL